jgi:Family of unknown function (DUF5906)
MKNTSILDALSNRRVFVIYRAVREPDGTLNKIPFNPTTGYNVTAHDSAHWMLPHEALLWAQQWDLQRKPPEVYVGVGIVLYPGSGVFCLDLDHCRDANGGWMPHAHAFVDRFPAAFVETSVSGEGRHLLVSYTGELPPHGVNNHLYRMQGYSQGRFIGLTGVDAEGSVLTDHTKALVSFLAEYFPEKPEPEYGVEWTDAPVDAWKGPSDDDELISRALRSHGPRSIFGGGAAFVDLWDANGDVLALAFPSASPSKPYDASAADQALANHLAFWTGSDCERMLRLMFRSGLTRDKWDRLEDYVKPTILNATGTQREWYVEKEPAEKASEVAASGSVPPPPSATAPPVVLGLRLKPGELPAPSTYISINMQKQIFDGMCYVRDIHQIQLPDGNALPKDRFDVMYAGRQWGITADGQRPSKSAWDAYVGNEMFDFPKVTTQYFRPDQPTGTIRVREGKAEINMYQPMEIRRIKGDATPFLDLVRKMLPAGNDANTLLYYMAACCQNLGTKFTWTPFIQGAKGNGKTTLGKVLEYCMSHRYTHWAKADQLGEKFNSVLVGKLLVIVDEMYSDDARELQEVLKQMVTSDRIEVRPMYAEKTMKEVCFNMFLMSNHQHGVRIDIDERRYAPFFCAQQLKTDKARDGLTKPYFIQLQRWLRNDGYAIVYDYLMDLAIPDELNPATHCIEAPETTSTALASIASLGSVEQEIIEAVKQQAEGFRNGWISSHAVDGLLVRCGKDRYIPRNARKSLVTSLGYVTHPALEDGVCMVPMPDGSKPRLYVQASHPWNVSYLSVQQVREGYLEAQKGV